MKKKIKILGLTLCALTLLGCGAHAITNMQSANAATELIMPQEYVIEKEYTYGQTFNVLDPSSVRIKTGGVETTASSVVLLFPDGTAKSEGSYALDKTGSYTLTYYNASGVAATHTFIVNKKFYGVDEGASATYVTNLVGQDGKKGVAVSLKDGTSFTFNKTIDLNDYAGQALEVCKIFPMFRDGPDVTPDASTVSVKIVDCYDESKFVEYYIWCGDAGQGVYYMGAAASTQVFTGLEQNTKRPHEMTEPYDGELYKIHRPSRYQSKTAWGSGMGSRDNPTLLAHGGMTLIWDLSNHQMKARNGGAARLITDIDSVEIYGTNAFEYDSFFTTGEVYLNIEVYNYTSNTFEFGLEEIFGMKGAELQNGTLVDNVAPQLFVDIDPTTDNRIYLQKGKAVTLPKLSNVLDYNYYGNSRVAVYRNYGKPGEVSLNVENGVFVPNMLGNYTAIYTAIDSYGNKGEYALEMVVLDEENIVYEGTALNKLVAAKANVLPYIMASGLNKDVNISVFVTTPNGNKTELEYNGVDGYAYIPACAGEYTVTYLFKDNVYEEEYSYKVACVDENSAVFQTPFYFPAYFIKGASYTVDPVTAYTAGNGDFNKNEAEVSVSVDGGAYQTLSKAQMQAYKVEANETLRFKASFGNDSVESPLYSVVDVGYGKKTTEKNYLSYLQGNYTAAALGENGLTYDFAGDAQLQFINILSGANFKLNFALEGAAEGVTVTLRDVRDPYQNYITYTYTQKRASMVAVDIKQYEDGKLCLDKNAETKSASLTGEHSLAHTLAGLETGGVTVGGIENFDEDNALLEIGVIGATNGCKVTISQINNQTFNATLRESKPQMVYSDCNGVQEINATHVVKPCYAASVLSPVLSKDVTVTVFDADGEVLTSVDGIRMEDVVANREYEIKLTKAGQYRVTYSVSCVGSSRTNGSATLEQEDYYNVNVSEGIAPTIAFKDGSNAQTTIQLSVGSSHTVKEFTVTDNTTASENIKVYTMILDKYFILEEDGYDVDTYVFKNVGEFIVCVRAYDELGNSSMLYYNVVVS